MKKSALKFRYQDAYPPKAKSNIKLRMCHKTVTKTRLYLVQHTLLSVHCTRSMYKVLCDRI